MPILTKFSRVAAVALVLFCAAGCAIMPGELEQLLASSEIVRERPREIGPEVAVARFSDARAGGQPPAEWESFTVALGKRRTTYRMVDAGGETALEARAERAASGLYRKIRIDPQRHPILEWRWKVAQAVPGADPRVPSREDSAARVVLSFHGDPGKLDFAERSTARLYHALSGEKLPFSMLMYVWADAAPEGTTAPNVHTEQIRMIVVDAGGARNGQWVTFRRNVLEDYRKVFGADPWDIVAVGVMTDSDNSGLTARALYGDITFRAQ
jgi:hypothetical protein